MVQISGIEHLHSGMADAFDDAATFMLHETRDIVELFTSAKRIQQDFAERQKAEKIGTAVGVAVGLTIVGALGIAPVLQGVTTAAQETINMVKAIVDLAECIRISINNTQQMLTVR